MATQNVNIGVNVSDNGTAKKTVKNFEEIAVAATKAQKAAAGINTPQGGTAGSRAVYAKAAPTGSQQMMSGEEYGRGRGAMGATGASARDFANQAQGLGGFVRLYATLAANAFAAEAAFRALSKAMDTTNMIKGLDQLGAASGTALGSLSKQLVNTTGGAISLREAMEATAKASSSGMSSENILRMGKAAKQASQALGVDMSDAVSRISRGITKLEPELLDELGIFVRVDDVVKKYAESTGKAASAVTDFEKRQAFANAVLDQAEKKFGAIDLDTNPYTKLAATIADLTQSTLEFVNKGLTPLVSLLSNSPTALAVVLGGIAATLVKQAIPAISDFRAGLASAAEDSKAVSQKKLQDVKTSLGAEMALRIQSLDDAAEAEFAKFESSSKKLLDLRASNAKKLKKYDQEALRISQLDPVDITPENIAYLETLASKQTKVSQVYKQIADDITAYKNVEKEYNKAQQDRNIILTQQHPLWTTIGQNEKVYHDEVNAARKRSASSQIAYTASTRGFMASMREAVKEFSDSKQGIVTTMDLLDESGKKTGTTLTTTTNGLGLFSRGLNLAKNAAVGMTAAVGTAISAFAPWLEVIGLIVAAGGALISWMSKTQEESTATSTALRGIQDSTKNLSDTIDVINKKSVLAQFDPKSIQATATAVGGLTDQIRTGFEAAYKELDKMGTSDQFVNFISKLWNGDVESELSDKVSKGLASVFKNVDKSSAAGKAATKSIQDVLKIDNLGSADAVGKALDSMSSSERRRAIDLISASVKTLGADMQISAARGTELQAAFGKAGEALNKFKTGFVQKDQVTEYGQALVDTYFKLSIALDDPQQKLQAIKTLAEGIKNVDAPVEIVLGLQQISQEVDKLNQVTKAIADIDTEISTLQDRLVKQQALILLGDSWIKAGALKEIREINSQLDRLTSRRKLDVDVQLNLKSQVENTSDIVTKAQMAVFKTGSELVASKMSGEWAKAGVTVTNAVASVLSGTEAGIRMRAQAEKIMLNAQAQQIKVQQQQILATEANTIALEQAKLDSDKQNLDPRDRQAGSFDKLDKKQADLDTRKTLVQQAQAGKMPARGMYAGMLNKVGTEAGKNITSESLGLVQSLENSMAQLANINAQLKSVDISTADQKIQLQYKQRVENLQVTLNALKVDQDRIAASKELNSETNQAAILDRQALDTRAAEFNYQKNLLAFEVEITRQKQAQKSVPIDSEQSKDIDKEIQRIKDLKQANEEAYAGSTITQSLKNRTELINASSKSAAQAANDQFVAESRALDTKSQQLDASEKLLELQNSAGRLSTTFYNQEKNILEQKKAQLAFDKEDLNAKNTQKTALDEISRKEAQLTAEKEARISLFEQEAQGFDSAVQVTEAELTRQRELAAERTRVNNTYTDTTTKAQSTLDILLKILGVTSQTNIEQSRYNDLLNVAGSVADTLKIAFEGAAESSQKIAAGIGNVVTALADFTINADKGQKSLADLNEKQADYIAGKKGSKDVSSEIAKQEKKNRTDEVKGYAQLAGAAKGMFKEKTLAYKVFAATEKVLHIASMAMKIQEMLADKTSLASKLATNAAGMASDIAAAGVSAVRSVVDAIKGPFPMNVIAGAATAAVVYGLVNALGGKSGPSVGGGSFVPTAEQRQETQGTAMGYDSSGNKIQVRRGVFGDTDAKSESIANSLEIIKDNSVDGLKYDNRMLRALEDLNEALNSAAKGLFGIRGLRAGSLSGVTEGTNTSGGLLGIGGLFSSSTSKSIVDSGLQLKGTFYDLAKGVRGTINTFETISTTIKKSGVFGIGGSTRTSVATQFKDLAGIDAKAFEALANTFNYAADLLYSTAETAGVSSDAVTAALKSISVDQMASLRGLTGEEFTKELSAVIGSVLDDASLVIFSSFEQYANFGEGMLETVVRVVDTNTKINQQIKNIGINSSELGFAITEVLAKAAGGLDKFLEQAEFFRENFLTEAERLVPVQKAVTAEMSRLGFASIDTRAEFKALVQGLDLTTESGINTYQSLMDLAPGFDTITKSVEYTVSSFRDFITQVKEFKQSLLLGASSTLTPGQKYAEARTQFETIYAQALAGDKTAMSKVTSSAQTFLDASKGYFASSDAYTQDFNSVLTKLDEATISAGASASVAELQLGALSTHTNLLTSIDSNIATIAGVPGLAGGGRASGLTIVGEMGPELVDFAHPGQVYSADQTAGMFTPRANSSSNMSQVVVELQQLRKEVTQLRKDQQQQTGDLIVSNYDANQKASEEIATAVVSTSQDVAWNTRSKSQIK